MLEKFLLNLKSLQNWLQNLLQKRKLSRPEPDLNTSPNLIESFKSDFFFSIDFIKKTTFTLKFLMLIFPLVFLFSLYLNDNEDTRLSQAEDTQRVVENDLLAYQGLESSAARVIGKTELYKEAKASFVSVSTPLNIVLARLPTNVKLDTAEFSGKKASLVVQSSSALDFALLIANYFKEPSVTEITLKSAELTVDTQQFTMSLDVLYK